MPVEVHLPQHELQVEVPPSNGMAYGGGLLGAMVATGVDNAASKNDERRIGPIRDLLLDTGVGDYFTNAISAGLSAEGLARSIEIAHFTESRDARLRSKVLTTEQRVLDLELRYAFTYDFASLRVYALATLGPRVVKGKYFRETKVKPYRVEVHSIWPLPGGHKKLKQDERAERWASLSTEELEGMVTAGMDEVVALLNFALPRLDEPDAWDGPKVRYSLGAMAVDRGQRIRGDSGRQWVAVTKGRQYMLLASVPE